MKRELPEPEALLGPAAARHLPAQLARFEGRMLFWIKMIGVSLLILAFLAVFAALAFGREVFMPVVAGIVVGLILGPLGERGRRLGIPASLTFSTLVLGIVLGIYLLALLLMPIAQDLIATLPSIVRRLGEWSEALRALFSGAAHPVPGAAPMAAPVAPMPSSGDAAVDIATRAMTLVTPAISQFVIFVFVLILFLAGRAQIRQALAMSFRDRDRRLQALKAFSRAENQLTDYFLVVSIINLALGALIGASFWAAGVPGAFSWALMAFVLNYLPVVGPLIMKASLLVFGVLFAPDYVSAIIPVAIFLSVSLIEANLITPKIIGDRITMNPLLVFLSVVFWTWLWGFTGAFLAMPLLAIFSVVANTVTEDKAPHLPA